MTRVATIHRNTAETSIQLTFNLDGSGQSDIQTGIGFFDHMLTLFAAHGQFDLTLAGQGDGVDNHHLVEDIGIVLGQAFTQAIGDKTGITRYAHCYLPMDEALCRLCIDISGRPTLVYDVPFTREMIGDLETEMIEEFFIAFVNNAKVTLHATCLYGKNNHHIAEGLFKGFGRTLKTAVAMEPTVKGIPSTKGVIE
ncbi:MAG: imidazoleglycerol-phosphate dehydratase HisB [Eubacteriaceae bacterium]|jgi:imidazoleglycerol-phosphate dehydratase|nr:imidazoleglycerol-phosphate dehydratase HisB [Eubacteriaceae bacterium]